MYLDDVGVPAGAAPGMGNGPAGGTPGPDFPRIETVSTEEELSEASRRVIEGKLDAIRCTGMVVPGVRETFDFLLEAGGGNTFDALLGLPATLQGVFSDLIEQRKALWGVLLERDAHKLADFLKKVEIKHPVAATISVGTLGFALYRARSSGKRRRETIDGKPFGPVCAELFRRGFRVRDNNGEAITLRRGAAVRPGA